MRVKLLKPWRHHLEGTILDIPGGVADILTNKRFAKEVKLRGRPPSQQDKVLRMRSKINDSTPQVQTK